MDPLKARQLARNIIPAAQQAIGHAQADRLGLTPAQAQAVDPSPQDGQLTQDDLYTALLNNQLELDPHTQRMTRVAPNVAFVERPPGPARDLHPGYSALGTRDPHTQPLQGTAPGSLTPPSGTTLAQLTQSVTTPDQVAQLLEPFGSTLYDTDRAEKGTGTGGAQAPAYTLEQRRGICRDSHFLGAYVLQQNGYNARQTGYKSEGIQHAVLTYEGKNHAGFGLVEYGTHYSPEQIAQILGRPALSHEEALQAVRPEAKLINLYSSPEANQTGYIEKLHYTLGNQLYQETLRLKHSNSLEYDRAGGFQLDAALNQHWGFKLSVDPGSSPDPTARHSFSAAAGYQVGDHETWLRLSGGVQYRPEEGHHSIGPNQWESHPALLLGGHAEGQWTAYKRELGHANHQLRTTLSGEATGALALSQGAGTDAANGTRSGGWALNQGLMSGMSRANLRLSQHLDGRLSDHVSYRSEVFAAPDLVAMGLGYGTGGKGVYANIGANASLHYNRGGFGAYGGAQYLAARVNNLEATGVSAGLSYSQGRFSIRADNSLVDSPEGWRLRTAQSLNYKLTDSLEAYGFAAQEQIYNNKYGHFNNSPAMNVGLGVQARF
jgi:hypothetical protein